MNQGNEFDVELLNPNVKGVSLKDGPKYTVTCEITKELFDKFMSENLTGLILEGKLRSAGELMREIELEEEKPKKQNLAGWLAQACNEEAFQEFVKAEFIPIIQMCAPETPNWPDLPTSKRVEEVIKYNFSIDSKSELNSNDVVREDFVNTVITPYSKWVQTWNR
ncbi:hypothetical protein OAF54_01765 [bacterium]|nr:hypothetical protein [bacterium]